MKELDLMHALEGVDDDILRDAERFEHRPRSRMLPRIAAVAAAAALLCGTVYAAVMGVSVELTGRTWIDYQEQLREDVVYSDIDVEYQLTEQEIPAEAMDFLESYLDDHLRESLRKPGRLGETSVGMVYRGRSYVAGSHWWYEDGEFRRPDGLESHYFQSVEEAEAFFGMRFALPECIRTTALSTVSAADDPGILLEVLSPPLAEEEQIQDYLESLTAAEAMAQIVPGFAELSFRVEYPTPELEVISGDVIIALNEAAVQGGYTTYNSVALDYLGKPEFPALDIDGMDGSLVVFPPCEADSGAVQAFYTCNGVGYILYVYLAEDAQVEDPAQLLLPWLEQLG